MLADYTGVDMEIKYTGLREGEKIYEELLISEEGIQKTRNDLIYVARPMEFDADALFDTLAHTREIIDTASHTEIVDIVRSLVPTFHPNNENFIHEEETETGDETVPV